MHKQVIVALLVFFLAACSGRGTAVSDGKTTVDQNAVDERGINPLLDAVGRGDLEHVRSLLKAGADPNAQGLARSPLVAAIAQLDARNKRLTCNLEMVELLLAHGVDPNAPHPSDEMRPLHMALSLGEVECANLLRERGARVDLADLGGRTLLDAAVAGAVHTGDMAIIDIPIAWGVDPNIRGKYGTTALTTAVWLDNADAVRVLLQKGVDPCITDARDSRDTPLHLAHNLKRSQATITLLEAATRCQKP